MARVVGLTIAAALLALMAYSVGPVAFVASWGAALGIACVIGWVVSNDWRWPFEAAAYICREIFGR